VDCGSTKWQQYFTYDAYGNIKKFVPTGGTGISFQPTYGNNNRYSGDLPGLSYDSNGNLLNDSFHVYTWDAAGQMKSVDSTTCGTNGVCLTYDALGRQVERTNGAGYVQYVYLGTTKLALMNGQTLTRAFIPLPGGTQGVYTTSFSKYRVPDWLGSFRIESTSTRTSGWSGAFAPFGERYSESGSAAAKTFAGHNWDTVSDLYDATFREQHGSQGRWTSPDPAGLAAVSLEDPQTWNRYAYVTNDPLTAVDPLGLFLSDVAPKPHYYGYSGLSWLSLFVDRLNQNHDAFTTEVSTRTCFSGSCSTWSDPSKIVYDAYSLVGASLGSNEFLGWNSNAWGVFAKSFFNGLIHGVRQPGQTFGECVNQNVSDTTFGTVDPQKLFNQGLNMAEETAALLAATKLPTAVGVSVPVGPYVVGQLARLAGLGSTGTAIAIRAGAAGMQTLAVGGAATAGLAIGSAINCR
jgi:RHS repeat-associated protein